MTKQTIHTELAPKAIGPYSQAIKAGDTVYLSGQIPLNPATGELVDSTIDAQVDQVFKNLSAVCQAAGGDFNHIVKLTIYLTNLDHFPVVNEAMANHFAQPYPARATIAVAALPKGAMVEIDAVMSV